MMDESYIRARILFDGASNTFYSKDAALILVMKLKKDIFTYYHSMNVALLTMEFSKHLDTGIPESLAYFAGLFHDIGKIDIESRILNKTGALSLEEYSRIKAHTEYGPTILSRYSASEELLLSARLHHEKCSGKGYPEGLKGREIPEIARIVNICDVYDALVSDRPYRKAYAGDKAVRIMQDACEDFDEEYLAGFIDFLNRRERPA